MTTTLPESHLSANEKLEGEAYFDLFEVHFNPSGVFYFHRNSEVTWQGNTYQGWAVTLNEVARYASEERARPTLAVMNIDGALSPFVADGSFNRAVLKRKRVLKQHILSDEDVKQETIWMMWMPKTLNKNVMEFELRTFSDGQNFTLPARKFMPPEWPYISLG